jgi:hypothetical protein
MANTMTNVTIELFDGWQGQNGITWRKGVILSFRSPGDVAQIRQVIKERLAQVKAQLITDGLLDYWYSRPVAALLIVRSQDQASGYKSVPRWQPRLYRPKDTDYLFAVHLGPKQGAYALEGYQVEPLPNSQGSLQQFKPLA